LVFVVLGLAFVVVGLGVATYSGVVTSRAARGRLIPLWRIPDGYRAPAATRILQLVAVLSVGLGSVLCFQEWGTYVILMLPGVFLPPFVVAALHNRATKRGE